MLKQALADIGQAQLFTPLYQWRFQFELETGDGLADSRLADMQGLRRALETAFFNHRSKGPQLTVFQSHINFPNTLISIINSTDSSVQPIM